MSSRSLLLFVGGGGGLPQPMLPSPVLLLARDHDLQQRVELVPHLARPPREPLQVPSPAEPHVVLEVEGPHELGDVLGAVPGRLRHVARQRAGHHAHDGVVGHADEVAADVDALTPGCRLARRPQHGRQLGLPHGAQLVDGARPQQLGHAEALHEAPVRAVGREGEAGVVVGEVARDDRDRPLRETSLVLEKVPCGVRGADDDAVRGGAEAEVDEGPVARHDAVQGPVRRRADEVQVADERERHRARGQPAVTVIPSPSGDDEGGEREEEEEERDAGRQQGRGGDSCCFHFWSAGLGVVCLASSAVLRFIAMDGVY